MARPALLGWLFEGKAIFTIRIALLAARDHVAFGGLSAAHDWNEMIHCQFLRWELSGAMMANTCGAFALPPLARAQLPRLLPFAPNLLLSDFDKERNGFHIGFSGRPYLYNLSRFLK